MHVCISNCINIMAVSSCSIRFFFVIITVLNSRSSSFLFKRIQIVVDWNSCEDRMNNANKRYKIMLYRILSNLSKIRHCSHIEMSQLVETQYQIFRYLLFYFWKRMLYWDSPAWHIWLTSTNQAQESQNNIMHLASILDDILNRK